MRSILLLSADLMVFSKTRDAAVAAGAELISMSNAEALLAKAAETPAELVVLDLGTAGLDPGLLLPKLKSLPSPPKAVIAFGPHVQEDRLSAAAAAGCDQVFTRGQFHAQLGHILREHLTRS